MIYLIFLFQELMPKINMLMIVFLLAFIIWEGESGQFTIKAEISVFQK